MAMQLSCHVAHVDMHFVNVRKAVNLRDACVCKGSRLIV